MDPPGADSKIAVCAGPDGRACSGVNSNSRSSRALSARSRSSSSFSRRSSSSRKLPLASRVTRRLLAGWTHHLAATRSYRGSGRRRDRFAARRLGAMPHRS